MIYSFDLLLPSGTVVDEELYDKFAINNMLDSLIMSSGTGPVVVNFLRSAASEKEAIMLARTQMQAAGYSATVRRHSRCHCGEWGCMEHMLEKYHD